MVDDERNLKVTFQRVKNPCGRLKEANPVTLIEYKVSFSKCKRQPSGLRFPLVVFNGRPKWRASQTGFFTDVKITNSSIEYSMSSKGRY